jgi:N-acetylmuramoyl-L-alanine amidase
MGVLGNLGIFLVENAQNIKFWRRIAANAKYFDYFCTELRIKSQMNKFFRVILCLVTAILCHALAQARDFVVVLDPGHGGQDFGTVGKKTNEKTVVLDVAKRLGEKLKAADSGIKVVYTRDDDRLITLQKRADIANKNSADLFISIHINSVKEDSPGRNTVAGASVYTLGLHKSKNNLNVAMRENSVMELENNYTTTYRGFDPNSAESYIIFELDQNVHLEQSIEFARLAQSELVRTAGRLDKKVRQAGFWVLWATCRPAVLVELDFLCNPNVEAFLNSAEGRDKCATALCNAVKSYKQSQQKTAVAAKSSTNCAVPGKTNTATKAKTKNQTSKKK